VQERTVIHAARSAPSGLPAAVKIGTYVTIEPNCMLRSCIIGNFCKVSCELIDTGMWAPDQLGMQQQQQQQHLTVCKVCGARLAQQQQ
jgi:ADP-glucose pyrophosphorylase